MHLVKRDPLKCGWVHNNKTIQNISRNVSTKRESKTTEIATANSDATKWFIRQHLPSEHNALLELALCQTPLHSTWWVAFVEESYRCRLTTEQVTIVEQAMCKRSQFRSNGARDYLHHVTSAITLPVQCHMILPIRYNNNLHNWRIQHVVFFVVTRSNKLAKLLP